jgi:elongation factor G
VGEQFAAPVSRPASRAGRAWRGVESVKKYNTGDIRNIGLFGHGGTGKTTVAEAILYDLGLTDRMGRVEDGNTVLDYDPDEHKRHISIHSALAAVEYNDTKINILDNPGFMDFVGEVAGSMAAVEAAVLVVATAAGVEVGIETNWAAAEELKLPRLLVLNKMDKENTDFYKTLGEIQEKLSPSAVAVQLPIGSADSFKGVVDLVEMKAYTFDPKGKAIAGDIPADMKDRVDEYRAMLVERAAEASDELTEKYLEEMDLSTDDLRKGVREGTRLAKLFPVVCTSASKNVGITTLLDAIVAVVPAADYRGEVEGHAMGGDASMKRKIASTEPFLAFVFKTTSDPFVGRLTYLKVVGGVLKADTHLLNSSKEKEEKLGAFFTMRGKKQENLDEVATGDIVVLSKLTHTVSGDTLCDRSHPMVLSRVSFPEACISMAIFPKSKGDEDKLSTGLARLVEEDPTFHTWREPETHQTLISGTGELHLEIMKDRLKRMNVDVDTQTPQVAYKESIRGHVKQEGKHKKQTGGHGQFGHVWLEIEPLERGKHFEFHDKIVGGVVPKNFIPSVEKGVRKAMEEGVVAGFPLVDVKVTLYDGSYHTVDSSDIAFQIAAGLAIREGVKKASPVLLEPVATVEVTVPEQYMGDVIGDLNGKRGRILGMDPLGKGQQQIRAQVPQAEMLRYAIDLRSMTQGRGSFKLSFSHYEELPSQLSDPIIAAASRKE